MSVINRLGYIYKIVNTKDNETYIGCTTKSINERWTKHRKNIYDPYCKHRPLYLHMKQVGKKHFHILCVEEVAYENISTLKQKEREYIEKYGTLNNHHNQVKHKGTQTD
jgi:predicted GIY-YIG superfamily endonuclease